MAQPGPSATTRIWRGALLGSVLGFLVALLVNTVDPGAVNPFLFGAFGIALGAGVAGDRRRDAP